MSKAAAVLLLAALLGLVSASRADQGTATYYTVYTRTSPAVTISRRAFSFVSRCLANWTWRCLICFTLALCGAASACYGFEDQGTMIAAASDALWDGGAACGRMYTVSCAGGTNATPNPCKDGQVTVKIVDRCPSPGCQATLDLSQQAFNAIGNLDAGKILINYNQYARFYLRPFWLPKKTRSSVQLSLSFFLI